jgi:hypothetical protein
MVPDVELASVEEEQGGFAQILSYHSVKYRPARPVDRADGPRLRGKSSESPMGDVLNLREKTAERAWR